MTFRQSDENIQSSKCSSSSCEGERRPTTGTLQGYEATQQLLGHDDFDLAKHLFKLVQQCGRLITEYGQLKSRQLNAPKCFECSLCTCSKYDAGPEFCAIVQS